MDIDFRRRCVLDGDGFDVIRYGVSAASANEDDGGHWWRDHSPNYADLSVGGRRPGNPIELEYAQRKHFFNKRIMDGQQESNEKSLAAKYGPVQGGGDARGVGARDGGGGAGRAEEAETAGGSAGRGDRDTNAKGQEGNKEVTT